MESQIENSFLKDLGATKIDRKRIKEEQIERKSEFVICTNQFSAAQKKNTDWSLVRDILRETSQAPLKSAKGSYVNQSQILLMPEIIRRRTIRPSTRGRNSPNYRVDIAKVGNGDTLVVEITHESKLYSKSFRFLGNDLIKRRTLSFRVNEEGNRIIIHWSSTQPVNG